MSWSQLLTILRENRQEQERERNEPPAACPNCGIPLEVGKDGVRNCPAGDYRWHG